MVRTTDVTPDWINLAAKTQTALHAAAHTGHVGAVTSLLARGWHAGRVDLDDHTPLDLAVLAGAADCVRVLWPATPLRLRDSIVNRQTLAQVAAGAGVFFIF